MPLWWLMCSARAGPMPFGAAWWVEPCAKTALLGGGGSAPTRAAPAGPGPCLGLSLPPRWLMPRPVEFLWAPWAGGARNRPVGAPGCTCKTPVLPSLGCGVPVHPLCGHRGGPNPWSTAPATQVAYLGAALRPGGGPWAAAPVPVTAGAGWAAVWAGWDLGGWRKGHGKGQQGCIGQPWWASVSHPGGTKCLEFLGPSLLPVVAETAAQNAKTVWHKTGHF